MKIFLLRHGIAAPRDASGHPGDPGRPLTREGRRKMEEAARGMEALGIRFGRILTSPLARAEGTARIVSRCLRGRPPVRVLKELSPGGDPAALVAALGAAARVQRLLLVGHEPDLSRLAGWMLTGGDLRLSLQIKKGGLCRIDFPGGIRRGDGKLVAHLTPRMLRACGRPGR